MSTQKQWITEKTGAAIGSFSIQTLRNWRHLGRGPAYSKINRSVRYDLEDFLSFIQQRRIDPEKNK
jgi:hypothetical protein